MQPIFFFFNSFPTDVFKVIAVIEINIGIKYFNVYIYIYIEKTIFYFKQLISDSIKSHNFN